MSTTYATVQCTDLVFDVEFHPKLDVICAGIFDGSLLLYELKEENKKFKKKWKICNHEKTIRCVSFSHNGKSILSASSDKKCSVTDITGKLTWINTCHNNTISSVLYTGMNTFLTADENGIIKHWDIRDESKKPIHKTKQFDDNISYMLLDVDDSSVVILSGGYLALFDILYKKKITSRCISHEYKDEFLCSHFTQSNSKVVCTTMNGYIMTFSKYPWANIEANIKGSKDMINTFVKIDEYTILYGTSDGLVKVAHLQQNQIGDVIAKHEKGDAIEKLTVNKKKNLLSSISHDNTINFYPININDTNISIKAKRKKRSFFRDL
ncbi:nucleolar Jumonji domain interacting protein, putative [Plasmodium ovale]|uniref:Nucleolar Jumonji domain interacting protein, putative n=2 Tax=Plasmodium ovale TaxID=36330 RepID=A0A1A8W0K9_PLAOA|nr:nucleolar Jumonji domain interacting protein, putative [Plasmodium ovale curtisi]SBS92392.1 nucleolar Jumonji domain interacting protein, putative [Plasmodium ovale curtisi]SCQ16402.1 nucleolar Jumonji domain interacting protein, putative [Plasmodium ovale]